MNKAYLFVWAMLLLNVVLMGAIRAMRKRHSREVVNLVDDCNTSRDKVAELREEIRNYNRVRLSDTAMIERLLRAHDQHTELAMEQRILLSKYKSLACFAYERCHQTFDQMRSGQYYVVREALRQLYNLETNPDAGKPDRNGSAESGQIVTGA